LTTEARHPGATPHPLIEPVWRPLHEYQLSGRSRLSKPGHVSFVASLFNYSAGISLIWSASTAIRADVG